MIHNDWNREPERLYFLGKGWGRQGRAGTDIDIAALYAV